MALNSRLLFNFVGIYVGILLFSRLSYGSENDILCLKSIKESLEDPNNFLMAWDFSNLTQGIICSFNGIDCWNLSEDRVLNIRLSDMGLKGSFPLGIKLCADLQLLDLSSNNLSGVIPHNISAIIPFVTSLDLSSNSFSGEIPVNLANCSFLNALDLSHNQLSGSIPPGLGQLSRLKKFSVANYRLVGPIPHFNTWLSHLSILPPATIISADSFANNPGLCGGSLSSYQASPGKSKTWVITAAAIGGVTVSAIAVGLGMIFVARRVDIKINEDLEENKWVTSIKGTKRIKVSLFENSRSKMRLSDLMKATDNFSKQNIISHGRTGTLYKAELEDGSQVMVKRLQDSQPSEKEFMSEMTTLGSVKHNDVVPLLAFCVAGKERLLVYEYMANGTLHDQLHQVEHDCSSMEWPTRLKIAIETARGLAWLHHNCSPRIIHGYISSKCILLDDAFEPKIFDFGLARLITPILMTNLKGDVYSFGIVLLELVTGEMPSNAAKAPEIFEGNLVEWVTELSLSSNLEDAIDKSLVGQGVDHELFEFLKVACNCVSSNPKERPSMFEVYQLLRAIGERYHFSDGGIMLPTDTGVVADEETSDQLRLHLQGILCQLFS